MDNKQFVIDVPAGPEHQGWCRIFSTRLIAGSDKEMYGLTFHSCLIKDPDILGSQDDGPLLAPNRGWLNATTQMRPTVSLKEKGRLMGPFESAQCLASKFGNLDWIGVEPDAFMRGVPKRILVLPYNFRSGSGQFRIEGKRLALKHVQMQCEDIFAACEDGEAQWQREVGEIMSKGK